MQHLTKPSDVYADKDQVDKALCNYKVIDFRKPKAGEYFLQGSSYGCAIITHYNHHFANGPRLIIEPKCSSDNYWE